MHPEGNALTTRRPANSGRRLSRQEASVIVTVIGAPTTKDYGTMSDDPIAYMRDLDGTGSFHACAKGDEGSFPVYGEPHSPDLLEALTQVTRAFDQALDFMEDARDRMPASRALVEMVCAAITRATSA